MFQTKKLTGSSSEFSFDEARRASSTLGSWRARESPKLKIFIRSVLETRITERILNYSYSIPETY